MVDVPPFTRSHGAMDPPGPRTSNDGWSRELAIRVRAWWLAKMLGTMLGMAAFFVVYFWLLRHPRGEVTVMPVTVVDGLIGFRPEALPIYGSLWLYVSLGPALLREGRELLHYGLAAAGLGALGLGIFFVWPTAVPVAAVDWSQHPAFAFLKSVDAAGNACPSLHVAFAVFTGFSLARTLRQIGAPLGLRAFNGLWCAAILYSTIATRQHVFLDIAAGATLGTIVVGGYVWVRWSARRPGDR